MRTAIPPCSDCGEPHPNGKARWRCTNDDCGKVRCAAFLKSGKQWNRQGQFVHLVTNGKTIKCCGVFERVADFEEEPAVIGTPIEGEAGHEPMGLAGGGADVAI